MLATNGMGLATLPMIGSDPEGMRKFLNVPDDYIITMLIAVGYKANKELPRQQRRGLHDIVNWDRFGQKRA
jgi:nitroreductase